MKRLFTLCTLLALAFAVQAQQAYRKSWDFTKWSATTIANFMADPNWTDDEKGDNYASKAATGENCRWEIKATPNDDGYVQANGVAIEELTGLGYISPSTNRGLAIATNYPDCTERDGSGFGPYYGAAYLWLCGKNTNYFVIPHVELGTTIKMGVESHKFSSERGVTLYIGHDNSGTAIGDPVDAEGNTVSGGNVTNYRDLTWQIPDDVEATNDDGTIDLAIRCNSGGGCHIYYITVGDGDEPQVEEAKKVAYLYDDDPDSDLAYAMLAGSPDRFDVTAININIGLVGVTLDSLQTYDAIVIAPTVKDLLEDVGSLIESAIAYVPVVNLSAALYDVLGYGQRVQTEAEAITFIDPAYIEIYGEEFPYDGPVTGVILGNYFKNDNIIAKAGEAVAMHVHNSNRNAYYFVASDNMSESVYAYLIPFTVEDAAKSKRNVTATGTPNITFEQFDGYSIVTITAANSTDIYYTLDGTDPSSENSICKLYTEPFRLDEPATVKAYAIGDGYTPSQVAEKEVTIARQAAMPTISVAREQGRSTVTLEAKNEGVQVYFSFNGLSSSTDSQLYTEPIELTEPATITAIADGGDFLPSNLATRFIGIDGIDAQNIRLDTLAFFDATEADWFINDAELLPNASGGASAYYFWGKSAWNYYSSEVDHEEVLKDVEGNDSIVYFYKPDPDALHIINPLHENGWILKSQGQVLTGELQLSAENKVGNGRTGRYAEEATDLITTATKGAITFGGKTSGEPYTASIETTGKLQGPFDVVVFCGNGNNGSAAIMEVQTSLDGETWATLDTLKMAATQRYIKRTRLSYNEAEPVYVRVAHVGGSTKAQVYDIVVLNNGELSSQYAEEAQGIETVGTSRGPLVRTEVFTIGGSRVSNAAQGFVIVRSTYADGSVKTVKMVK